jgi:hypothetical protein
MSRSVLYAIDGDDRIVDVNAEWSRFARQNGGNPDPDAVIGKVLWDFIVDDGNRSIYQCMVHTVRTKVAPLHIPFRCDSPTVERHMTMTIAPGSLGEVAFICALQYSFDRPPRKVGGLRRETETIVECDECHRLYTKNRGWQDCWNVIMAGDLEIDDRPLSVLHTRCPKC